eukprot:SAG11_NODE_224_length_12103_cov_8.087054_8_plen_193_part_00
MLLLRCAADLLILLCLALPRLAPTRPMCYVMPCRHPFPSLLRSHWPWPWPWPWPCPWPCPCPCPCPRPRPRPCPCPCPCPCPDGMLAVAMALPLPCICLLALQVYHSALYLILNAPVRVPAPKPEFKGASQLVVADCTKLRRTLQGAKHAAATRDYGIDCLLRAVKAFFFCVSTFVRTNIEAKTGWHLYVLS